jgi:hypothetical protein
VHTRDWVLATVAARLRLPWLPSRVGFARTAILISVLTAAAFAAVVAAVLAAVARLPFWPVFEVALGTGLGWWAFNWARFWRAMRRRPPPGRGEWGRHLTN